MRNEDNGSSVHSQLGKVRRRQDKSACEQGGSHAPQPSTTASVLTTAQAGGCPRRNNTRSYETRPASTADSRSATARPIGRSRRSPHSSRGYRSSGSQSSPKVATCNLLELRTELLELIAAHLPAPADVRALSRTCRHLRALTSTVLLEAAWRWRQRGNQGLWTGRLPLLRRLIEVHHADINTPLQPRGGAAPAPPEVPLLYYACRADRVDIVAYLIAHPSVDINQAWGPSKLVALHAACAAGAARTARLLLAQPDLQVNAVDASGFSALHRITDFQTLPPAFQAKQQQILRQLLQHPGIDVNLRETGTGCALSPLTLLASRGDATGVALLLQQPGIQVNAVGTGGATALHRACEAGQVGVTRLLLRDARVNVNAVTACGETPLVLACFAGHGGVIGVLLQQPQIDSNIRNRDGLSGLDIACAYEDLVVIHQLLKHPGLHIPSARFALRVAVHYRRFNVVTMLLGVESPLWNAGAAAELASLTESSRQTARAAERYLHAVELILQLGGL